MANSLNALDLQYLDFNQFGFDETSLIRDPDNINNSETKTTHPNAFEFKFHTIENLSFTGISLEGVYRKNNDHQSQMISIVDTSPESDKQSMLFCGDLFNYFLGKQICAQLDQANDTFVDSQSKKYLSTLVNLRGFPHEQIMFCSSPYEFVEQTLKMSSSLIGYEEVIEEVKNNHMELQFMAHHRLLQPILNISSNKIKRSVELLGLDPENPTDVIRTLSVLRDQL